MRNIYDEKKWYDCKNIVLWGAGVLGKQVLNMGLPVTSIWDVGFAEVGTLRGISVERPLSGEFNKEDTLVIICVGNKSAQTEISGILKINNYQNVLFFNDVENIIYSRKVKSFKILNQSIKPGGTVFIGDSITEQFRLSKYFPNINIYNRGIGGDTVAGLLKRLDESVFELKPEKVFICIGTNDIAKKIPVDTIVQQLCALMHILAEKLPEAKILVISILPVYSGDSPDIDKLIIYPRTNELIRELNKKILNMSSDGNFSYINVHDKLTDNSCQLDINLTTDGLHLNKSGYEVFAKALESYLIT